MIVDSTKSVDAVHAPIPVELLTFGLAATLAHLAPDDAARRRGPAAPTAA